MKADTGIITAWTHGGGVEDEQANRRLGKMLHRFGYRYSKGWGAWKDDSGKVHEDRVFIVPHMSRNDAVTLGIVFGQMSVITDMKLVATSTQEWNGKTVHPKKTLLTFHRVVRGSDVPDKYVNYTRPDRGVPFALA